MSSESSAAIRAWCHLAALGLLRPGHVRRRRRAPSGEAAELWLALAYGLVAAAWVAASSPTLPRACARSILDHHPGLSQIFYFIILPGTEVTGGENGTHLQPAATVVPRAIIGALHAHTLHWFVLAVVVISSSSCAASHSPPSASVLQSIRGKRAADTRHRLFVERTGIVAVDAPGLFAGLRHPLRTQNKFAAHRLRLLRHLTAEGGDLNVMGGWAAGGRWPARPSSSPPRGLSRYSPSTTSSGGHHLHRQWSSS